jgi:hypothetical protein
MQYYILFNTFLIILGVFLPWLQPGLFVAGHRGIETSDGRVVAVIALIAFLTISYELIKRKERLYWLYGGAGFAVTIITSLVLYNYYYQNNYTSGPGVYLSLLGGVQITGTYVVYLFKQGRRSPPPA